MYGHRLRIKYVERVNSSFLTIVENFNDELVARRSQSEPAMTLGSNVCRCFTSECTVLSSGIPLDQQELLLKVEHLQSLTTQFTHEAQAKLLVNQAGSQS